MDKKLPVAYKCKQCGRVTYPKRVCCLKCKSQEFDEISFSEYGHIITFTQTYQLPWGIDEPYLTLGVIKFDNGIKSMGRISQPEVSTGAKVKASWEKIRVIDGEDVYGWMFTPA